MNLLLAALFAVQTSPTPPPLATEVGAMLPALELPRIALAGDAEGSLNLATLRGKRVLLLQFASW